MKCIKYLKGFSKYSKSVSHDDNDGGGNDDGADNGGDYDACCYSLDIKCFLRPIC